MIGIQNPSSTDRKSGIQELESRIHGVESRIQDYLGFLYMGRKRFAYIYKLVIKLKEKTDH